MSRRNTSHSTGYGPRSRLLFDGNADTFPIWETRFINYLYTLDKGPHKAILPKQLREADDEDYTDKNRWAYAELVQVLDERSVQLIMTDAANDGRAAYLIRRQHFASTEKPRVLTLYEELTTLLMRDHEDITDYIIRAERATTGLRAAGEVISDNLIIAMLLKRLPESYKPFVVIHTQLDIQQTFPEFKAALHNYAGNEAISTPAQTSSMAVKQLKQHTSKQCLSCGKKQT